ncbi:molybdopterin cofactor-binding domain-containing protein [Lysobacter sp. CA199]|uniref:xanthine dehydrogenase family protein molybdopterin-binding subunit n=1 Tax=Lysobacter sp. CA199 TaxID=3455608 RepID=UPI003F8D228A
MAELSRRDFLRSGAVLGGGLVIAFALPQSQRFAFAQTAPATPPAADPAALDAPDAFLRIGDDDSVTVLINKSEMGQGVWTTLPMLVAEELDVDWDKIRVEHAPAAPAYAALPERQAQLTGGSGSTRSEFERYRQVGATARAVLIAAAAQRFGVDAAACRTERGSVIAGTQRARYGELAAAAARLPLPKAVTLKDPKDWTVIGKPTKRLDSKEKITGQAKFGMDVQFEGLLTALVARAPVFGGKVKSFDAAKARAVPGVRDVVQVPSGVAVIADHYWAAKQGRDALIVEWDAGPNAGLDTAALGERFRRLADTDGKVAARSGDVQAALARATGTVEAEYLVPYLAHAPMEPLNCTVRITDGGCEIWTGTQFQSGDQRAAAKVLGIEPARVTLHTMFLGGSFGRRISSDRDFVTEAVHVAQAAGRPVKTVWTREDDLRGGHYRPMFLHRARIALDRDGHPSAWRHVLVGQPLFSPTPDGIDGASVEGVADSPYLKGVPDHRVDLHAPRDVGIPVQWWRSVGHSHTAFVMESLIDELADLAGRDPVAYRRALFKQHPRHLGVLEAVAEHARWEQPLAQGRARGVAVHESFGSYVAQVAEVSVDGGAIVVHNVVCVIDCGVAINPEGVRAQMESGIAFGLSAALGDKLTFKHGRVEQSNFHD